MSKQCTNINCVDLGEIVHYMFNIFIWTNARAVSNRRIETITLSPVRQSTTTPEKSKQTASLGAVNRRRTIRNINIREMRIWWVQDEVRSDNNGRCRICRLNSARNLNWNSHIHRKWRSAKIHILFEELWSLSKSLNCFAIKHHGTSSSCSAACWPWA